jgi:hypothetical protein
MLWPNQATAREKSRPAQRWRRVAAADHPDRYVKTMVTRTFSNWRRRWAVRNVVLSPSGEPS